MEQNLIHQYITEVTLRFLTSKGLMPGDRYNIYFEKIEEVKKQFAAFTVNTFDYDEAIYEVSYIQINDVKLIIACNSEDTTEDFLTKLRNRVSENKGIFTNTTILFIHNTQLDSITGGTESLLKEGMPLHVNTVKNDIRTKIDAAGFLETYEKLILLDTLDQQNDEIFENNNSLFDFKVYLEILTSGDSIKEKHYKDLGLFKDNTLTTNTTTTIKNRISNNRFFFNRVNKIHQFGTPSDDLEKEFISAGVKQLEQVDSWHLNEFKDVEEWAAAKKKSKKPEYSETIIENDGLVIWEKPEGISKAKQRQRNIIVFNNLPNTGNTCDTINLVCKFNSGTRTQQNNIKDSVSSTMVVNYSASGKKIELNLTPKNLKDVSYCKIGYEHIDKESNDKTNFEFRIFILPMAENLLKSIKTNYVTTVKQGADAQFIEIRIDNIEDDLFFNEVQKNKVEYDLTIEGTYNLEDDSQLQLKPNEDYEESFVNFKLKYKNATIPFRIKIDHEELRGISGLEVWQQKRIKQESFQYHCDNKSVKEIIKLKQGNHEYTVRDEFRKNLKFEEKLITSGGIYWNEQSNKDIKSIPLEIPVVVKENFEAIIQYYREKNLLPSLTSWDGSLRKLVKKFIEVFLLELKSINTGVPLNKQQRNLENIGVIKELHGKERVKYTPLHPINLAYQLALYDELGKTELPKEVASKLTPLGIVPYMYGDIVNNQPELFAPIEQTHSQEWLYFHSSQVETSSASKRYAPKLVKDKINEFTFHFHYLFLSNSKTPLKINLINLGDCKEAFQGIFNYYKSIIKEAVTLPIDICIYGSDDYITKFEEFAFHDDVDVIEREFGISLKLDHYDPEDILNVFRQNVHFYNKQFDEGVEYAHLSFYQFKQSEMTPAHNTAINVPTGLSLRGLVNDVPSVFLEESYRTGFGALYLPKEQASLLEELAILYNALVDFAKLNDTFNPDQAICTVVNDASQEELEQLYNHSQWITFIDPKVDLKYFSDKTNKNTVIIHYSDQYSNTSGYDAITVTRKSEQYQFVISEHLKSKLGISMTSSQVMDTINMFNALNGDWLLRLISQADTYSQADREKISILSAVKVALTLLYHDNIIWVPISLEEVLRISGGAGLIQKEGIFSAKNRKMIGKHSDDLLMIGLETFNEKLLFHLFPIEVKIGKNHSDTKKDAIEQAQKTADEINDALTGINHPKFLKKFYRNFFARMVLVSVGKMKLYSVWQEQNWDNILTNYRQKLLNDDFEISTKLNNVIGKYAVMLFHSREDFTTRSISYENDGCIIELHQEDGYKYLLEDIPTLLNLYKKNQTTISSDLLLQARYKKLPHLEPTETTTKGAEPSTLDKETKHTTNKSQQNGHKSNTAFLFDKISEEKRLEYYNSTYRKLNSIGVKLKKVLPVDIKFLEGPTFFRFELVPEESTKVAKIKTSAEEIAPALKLPEGVNVRIFQDRGHVWVEVPKDDSLKVKVTTQHLWQTFQKQDDKFAIPFGVDIEGKLCTVDFSSSNSPHLLLAGTTGSGKSVVLDTLIRGGAEFYTAQELQMFLIDPKGNELVDFEDLPHVPNENGTNADDAISLLTQGVEEMEYRYALFKNLKKEQGKAAKDIVDYNLRVQAKIPRWMIILDEYGDLIEQDSDKRKTIESLLKRLSQKARAAGIHVIVTTQKPTTEIVNTTIKSNLPGVIALKVKTSNDSRVILDENGAETLAGKGDSLFKNGTGSTVRVQCAIYEE